MQENGRDGASALDLTGAESMGENVAVRSGTTVVKVKFNTVDTTLRFIAAIKQKARDKNGIQFLAHGRLQFVSRAREIRVSIFGVPRLAERA